MPVVVLHRGPGDLANRLCEDGVAVRTYSGRNEEGYVGLCSDPAPVVSNEGILVFHEDKDNHGDLWVTSRSGGLGAIYSEDTRIDTEVMTGSPGAVAVDNAVYVFYQQHAKYGYWLAGRRFIGPASTTSGGFASTGITGSPRAVVFSGWTYIPPWADRWLRQRTPVVLQQGPRLRRRRRAGRPVRASIEQSGTVVFDDDLYVFYQDENELGDLCVAILHKGKWRHECISSRVMSKSPTAVVAPDNQGNDRLIVFYQGYRKNGSLCSTTFDGTTWSEYRKPSENYLTGSPSAVYR